MFFIIRVTDLALNKDDLLKVGVITTTHGVHGEVKVFPTTDDVKRFKKAKELLLDKGKEIVPVKIQSVKFFKQFVILKIESYDTMNDALTLKNCDLLVTRENAVKCDKDEYFIADLYGITVFDESDNKLGIISNVYQTGANDVYEIEMDDKKTFLIPAIKECVLNVDINNKVMTIHVMDGLL